MEFHIQFAGTPPETAAIEQAIRSVDPAAIADIDAAASAVRVATSLDATHLAALLGEAGLAVAPAQVTQLPSTCCGGCSA